MSVPDLRRYCQCDHVVAQHAKKAPRPCSVTDCDCAGLFRAPLPLCGSCRHRGSLHAARRDAGSGRCCATGCGCPDWVEPSASVATSASAAPIEVTTTAGIQIGIPMPQPGGRVRMKLAPGGALEIFLSGGKS